MDSEEDSLYYSQEKFKSLLETTTNHEKAINKYLNEANYPHMGDFKPGLEWFNVSEPLSLTNHLKGKLIVLDFFTYCCINCMHILPDLKKLENEFTVEDGLVVVGVHSAKFQNERDSANILAAVQRYNITHPVVNDKSNDMWNKYDINCWPTLLLMDPNAKPLILFMGEGNYKDLRTCIKHALNYYKSRKLISNHKLPIKSAFHLLPELKGPLLFPGKIATMLNGNVEMLAISDTGNNRVLISIDGVIIEQIGGSKQGFKDGSLEKAEFNQPQGLAFLDSQILFVADTDNHAIRKINLQTKEVTTIAGTGLQINEVVGGKIGKEQGISSPWDLCIYKTTDINNVNGNLKDVIIVAMAGAHQIWAVFLDDIVWWKNKSYKAGTVVCIAGSGREENRNNQYPNNAAFAQPSGLALCKKNKEVYIADSESSSIRRLSLIDGKVTCVVGGDRNPNNLFAFGDRDGSMYDAKLQHSLGLALSKDETTLFVADTYNHKIKKIDISKNFIRTLNPPGDVVDNTFKTFNEPAGLCTSVDGTKLYLADTNNHAIKIIDLTNDFNIDNINKLDIKFELSGMSQIDKSKLQILSANTIKLNSIGGKIILKVNIEFFNGLKLTVEAPNKWLVDCSNRQWSASPSSGTDINNIDSVISISKGDNAEYIDVIINLITCMNDSCYPKNFILRQNVEYDSNSEYTMMQEINIGINANDVFFT